jgi:hypothetical protein
VTEEMAEVQALAREIEDKLYEVAEDTARSTTSSEIELADMPGSPALSQVTSTVIRLYQTQSCFVEFNSSTHQRV